MKRGGGERLNFDEGNVEVPGVDRDVSPEVTELHTELSAPALAPVGPAPRIEVPTSSEATPSDSEARPLTASEISAPIEVGNLGSFEDRIAANMENE